MSDPELRSKTKSYEEAKPLTGRLDVKINRIAVRTEKNKFYIYAVWKLNTFCVENGK